MTRGLVVLALGVAIGLASAGWFVSQTLYNAKVALNTAEAKGLAERRVRADLVSWDVPFSISDRSGTRDRLEAFYARAERSQSLIVETLRAAGFDPSEITIGGIEYRYQEFRDDDQTLQDELHVLSGVVSIETVKVERVQEVRSTISKLITQGINVENRAPRYRFTQLNEIKPEMLREAARNARIAASEFAANAGAEVGRIQSARQGNFFIRDVGADYGDTAKIEKDVRVVTTITFYLTE